MFNYVYLLIRTCDTRVYMYKDCLRFYNTLLVGIVYAASAWF